MADFSDNLIGKYVKNILDVMPAGVFISDISGTTLYVNRVYEQLTGIRLQDVKGRNVRSLVQEGTFDFVLNPEIVRDHKAVTRVQHLQNGKRLVLTGVPVFDETGILRLVVTFARDITLLSELQNQVANQHKLIAQMNDQLSHINEENKAPCSVFSSESMEKTIALLKQVAPTDATVLILGETGVGKDVMGRLVHSFSNRKDKILVKVDCGAISASLIESELFGYTPGAFTGASSKGKAGYFELAEGSTIFLDEIGELPLPMQTKLLRVLQDGEIIRVGSSTPRKVNVRVVAATNRDLAACVEEGTFRRDLFYRLNVASVFIPPLRDRKADIPLLAEHFLSQYSAKYRKTMAFMPVTLDLLTAHSWPGNVRELQNLVHSLVITLTTNLISPADLPKSMVKLPDTNINEEIFTEGITLKEIMAEKERDFLRKAIQAYGSVQKVAKMFKVDRSTIFRKLNGG